MSSSQQPAGVMEKASKAFHPLFACPSQEPVHKRKERCYQNYPVKMSISKRNLRMAPDQVKPHLGS